MRTKIIKKVAAVFAVFAMMATTGVAFAGYHHDDDGQEVEDSGATVTNNINAGSYTGGNSISGNRSGTSRITTGNASSMAGAVNVVNTNVGSGSDGQEVEDSGATVTNNVGAVSDTGLNTITNDRSRRGHHNGDGGTSVIDTGNAVSMAGAVNVINTNVAIGCCEEEEEPDCGGYRRGCYNDDDGQEVEDSGATVANNVNAKSFTGENEISGSRRGVSRITTGNASSMAGAVNVINTNVAIGCPGDCGEEEGQEVEDSGATVSNNVGAVSDTGLNTITNDRGRRGCYGDGDESTSVINTGNTTSRSGEITVINSNISRSMVGSLR